MHPRLGEEDLAAIDQVAAPADERLERLFPGDRDTRQPVHTVYVPADRVDADLTRSWGRHALRSLDEHAPTPGDLARATGLPSAMVDEVWPRLTDKLGREPVEDLRIDLEDGYGRRDDAQEDGHAVSAAEALRRMTVEGTAPPFAGVRVKSMEASTRRRGLRSLDLVLGVLLDGGELPRGWTVTLPKVTGVEQVEAMASACERLESAHGLPAGRLRFEVQVETPQAVLGPDGVATVSRLVHAGRGRVGGLHYGTYDYSAALGIAADHQSMDHPAADHAKQVMLLAAAGTGVRVSDGSTNVLPVGDRAAVQRAWALHARLVLRSLERGFYQGWDLHPAQLPTRFAATYLFFRRGLTVALARLQAYSERESVGILDEPATVAALTAYLRRGVECGAVSPEEVER